MAEFPKGPAALSKAGYIYLSDGHCKQKDCDALIHWYKYSPTGQVMPIDSITQTPHWLSCAGRAAKKEKPKPPEPPPDPQQSLFEPNRVMREPGED